jgi:hypothetical protein
MKSIEIINHQIEDSILNLKQNPESADVYYLSKKLADCARELIHKNQMTCFKRCLRSVSSLYDYSKSNKVRLAIENVFVYRIADVIMLQKNRKFWMNLLPVKLKEIMYNQVFAIGI